MIKCEFSETQFVVAYLREALSDRNWRHFPYHPWFWSMPSTVEEAEDASDLIMRNHHRHYTHSIFYQFKRSNFYNYEVFTDINEINSIDTNLNNSYGFKIYNKTSTQQFNKLKLLAQNENNEVYYCAPIFHTNVECMNHFRNNSVLNNSKLIDFSSVSVQNINIPLDSSHKVIFDRNNDYICSDIHKVKGYIAKERLSELEKKYSKQNGEFLKTLDSIREILNEKDFEENGKTKNIIYLRDQLMVSLNILWIPYFKF